MRSARSPPSMVQSPVGGCSQLNKFKQVFSLGYQMSLVGAGLRGPCMVEGVGLGALYDEDEEGRGGARKARALYRDPRPISLE